MEDRQRQDGPPPRQGLYDPARERDACGIGFVADVHGRRSHGIVRQGLQLLDALSHRAAVGADPLTGDGAGVLLQLPDAFLRAVCAERGLTLPEAGAYGVGMIFLPREAVEREKAVRFVERALADEHLTLLGWREVPTDVSAVGPTAAACAPDVAQLFVARDERDEAGFERALYVARRRLEKAAATLGERFYVASLSSRTIVYKGMLIPRQIPLFYPELADERVESALALLHSRFSTNTFPSWARAHPYRFLCHNGEINTLRGNVNWMRVREGRLEIDRPAPFGNDIATVLPVVAPHGSDSAALDNAVEFLVMGGRSLAHAMAMLVPEAWGADPEMSPERRAFYEYHASLMEPWDGPAAVAFTDGRSIGALLDRNGLRPARWLETEDGLVVLASEAGVLPIAPERIRRKGRLQPGRMLLVDTEAGRLLHDHELKAELAARRPYRAWVDAGERRLEQLPPPPIEPLRAQGLLERQVAFGYTQEELKVVLTPMATGGQEPVGSMGNDTPLAVLSHRPQLLFRYFKQLFAQVTNPPIDPIREELVMSLAVLLGPRGNLLTEAPEHAHKILLSQPVLDEAELRQLAAVREPPFQARTLDALFDADAGAAGFEAALEGLLQGAARAVREGCTLLILSDRLVSPQRAAIPALLATAAVHHHLIREGLRTSTDIVVETGEAREVAHFALLVGFGAAAVAPWLALQTVRDLASSGALGDGVEPQAAQARYVKAVGKGLLKIFSKMGISTLQSYTGAQVFEAVGLDGYVVSRFFPGTESRIGGVGLSVLAEEALARHWAAFSPRPRRAPVLQLDPGGEYHFRAQGEQHLWTPAIIASLQRATREADPKTFAEFSRLANEADEVGLTLRALLDFVPRTPVPVEEVEPASEIVKRFVTGAMSFGSISREAHETMAIAMNRIGGRSNTGEGGEDPARFLDDRNSAIKQVASGRFGVTTEYLVNARELQIKMAQGAKPGEGGQLPGHKVDEVIARTRHSIPGVTLISPPPHHDIYSIEDLAQLIADLKTVNPDAAVSVKLVATVGVGTIAAGVAKAYADLVVIAGDGGGTGASPLSSIKHAGIPWELGLAETQQTLVLNGLRGRIRVQADGQLKTGRDVMVAALLGADEFGFATAPLIVEGCLMMRKCHLNTCPVGIATQDPVLRAKFAGKPEHVVNYFFFVAEEARRILARLGLRSMNEAVGRTDLLRARVPQNHWKARTLHLDAILHTPLAGDDVARRRVASQPDVLRDALDHQLIELAAPALERSEPVRAELPIRNAQRSVGAMLSGLVARRYGHEGLPDDTIHFRFRGSAGQSFGAFGARGLTLHLEGESNDYVGKGLSGARLVIVPPAGARFRPEETIIVGNTVLYGATGGEAYVRGTAGERFAVRNSGALAVVEGVGDHGCEYMTGGTVVVLGAIGRNFGAGMSGGVAYVLDEDGSARQRVNTGMVVVEPVPPDGEGAFDGAAPADRLKQLIEAHAALTGSERAAAILADWDAWLPRFVQVIPLEYRRVLQQRAERAAAAAAAAREEVPVG